jgi:hypothetical protein
VSRRTRSKTKRANGPPADEPWIWFTREMLESDAWQAMPISARKVVERIALEHMAHAGTQNGELIVTYDDFARFGLRRESISEAINVAVALGFLAVAVRGRRAFGSARRPSLYALAWLPRCDGTPATGAWRSIQGREKAEAIAEAAMPSRGKARRRHKRRASGDLGRDIDSRGDFASGKNGRSGGDFASGTGGDFASRLGAISPLGK